MSQREWKRISEFAMRSAPWQVSRSVLDGRPAYLLWHDEEKAPLGVFSSFADATRIVGQMEEEKL